MEELRPCHGHCLPQLPVVNDQPCQLGPALSRPPHDNGQPCHGSGGGDRSVTGDSASCWWLMTVWFAASFNSSTVSRKSQLCKEECHWELFSIQFSDSYWSDDSARKKHDTLCFITSCPYSFLWVFFEHFPCGHLELTWLAFKTCRYLPNFLQLQSTRVKILKLSLNTLQPVPFPIANIIFQHPFEVFSCIFILDVEGAWHKNPHGARHGTATPSSWPWQTRSKRCRSSRRWDRSTQPCRSPCPSGHTCKRGSCRPARLLFFRAWKFVDILGII